MTLPLFERGNGDEDERVYRVGQLNRMARMLLEGRFANVWVEGELSDVSSAASGHVYFSLNDEAEEAQVRGVMFRSDARRAKAKLENGARVKLRGRLSLYEPRGSYQLIAQVALPLGLGELHAEFERVRKKLEAEGLLAPERKRPLPMLPRVLGVVTSEHGAALHDVIRVACERCPTRVVLSPCLVQGRDAPASIVRALLRIQRLPGLDVVIVGRGGGAAEDLFAFNDEAVARAIASCRVPVVSAVGHEVDVTIADLVADVRAATPSNAAELCVPDRVSLERTLAAAERALSRAFEVRLGRMRLRLDRLQGGLRAPQTRVQRARARLQRAKTALIDDARRRLHDRRRALGELSERVARCDPRLAYARDRARLHELRGRLLSLGARIPERARAALAAPSARLHALSPLAVLSRGYAIALHLPTGKALLRAADARAGDALELRLHDGSLQARVERES